MDWRKQWDRWMWLIPAIIIVLFFSLMFFGRAPFCASNTEEHCFREWVSALSGWGAFAAAVLTVGYLAKQVKDAERFGRASIQVGLMSDLAAARHLNLLSKTAVAQIGLYLDDLSKMPKTSLTEDVAQLVTRTDYLIGHFSRSEFHGVNAKFSIFYDAPSIVRALQGFRSGLDAYPPRNLEEVRLAAQAAKANSVHMAYEFSRDMEKTTTEWIVAAEELLAFK